MRCRFHYSSVCNCHRCFSLLKPSHFASERWLGFEMTSEGEESARPKARRRRQKEKRIQLRRVIGLHREGDTKIDNRLSPLMKYSSRGVSFDAYKAP